MFYNESQSTSTVFASLRESGWRFFLTGSRYFGTATDESDWDFFVQVGQDSYDKFKAFMMELGFYKLHTQDEYQDRMTTEVWRIREDVKVDIQVVRDAELKKRAQEYLLTTNLYTQLAGTSRVKAEALWNLAFASTHGHHSYAGITVDKYARGYGDETVDERNTRVLAETPDKIPR